MGATFTRRTPSKHSCIVTLKMTRMSWSASRLQWFKPVLMVIGHVIQSLEAVYWTIQAARRWHTAQHKDFNLDGRQWIPCREQGKNYIHEAIWEGLHDAWNYLLMIWNMTPASSHKEICSWRFNDEILYKYSRDFEITGGHHLMESFIGLDVGQCKSRISNYLDESIQETLDIYKAYPGFDQERRSWSSSQSLHWCRGGMCSLPKMFRKCQARSVKLFIVRYFCASAGQSHIAAIHHLMEYLEQHHSFELEYYKGLLS